MDEDVSIPLSNRRFDWFTQTLHPIGPSFTDKAFTNMATFMSACKVNVKSCVFEILNSIDVLETSELISTDKL
jgi:hypothetical protein